jgi:cyclohexanone monooxygenase
VDYWANGFRTLHGFTSNGFPNWFYIGISQNALSVNMTAMFDDQARHIAYIISEAQKRQALTVEPTVQAQDAWVATVRSLAVSNRDFLEACTPGYYNNEGSERPGSLGAETYAPGLTAFNALIGEWRDKGTLEGLELGQ